MNAKQHILSAIDLLEEAKDRIPSGSYESGRVTRASEHLQKALEIEEKAARDEAINDPP